MIIHIVSKSPLQHSALNDALPYINTNDKLVLIDDGVYAGMANTSSITKLEQCNCECFALEEDIQIRGISVVNSIKKITIADFVDLVFCADKSISWY